MSVFIEVHFSFPERTGWKDILIAELDNLGYNSFAEEETGLKAYIRTEDYKKEDLLDLIAVREYGDSMTIESTRLEDKNWNEIWESGFDPVDVSPLCRIRAPFHQPSDRPYELVIQPKMSFGTGHHPTTHLMMEFLLEESFADAQVLDMGCGTGILAILAEKRGAGQIDAADIDPWCIENTRENLQLNRSQSVRVMPVEEWERSEARYSHILANINRNVLIAQLPVYRRRLKPGGSLFLSGFYLEDLALMDRHAADWGLEREKEKSKNNWVSAKYVN